ncbi:hypothetical protein IRJ41_023834 [Triplophysa rosa]|uniref:Uncharacterized protein n=1 Tax=Triplophysa rosa TaxID=992332 RepID=A0A9W7TVA0_TRIRA|nr:hypothetical protein IRJ41_023834 [Triplophysa rosa]
MSLYSVVEFTDEYADDGRTVMDVIPTSWITGTESDECFWPTGKTTSINKAVKKQLAPSADWAKYDIRIIGNADTYAEARAKLSRAEDTSDVQYRRTLNCQRSAKDSNPRAANTRHPAQRVADTHPAAQSVNTTRSPANRFKDTRFGAQMNPVNVTGSAQEVTATVPANQSITTSDYAMFIKLLTLLEEVKKTQRVHSNMLNALLKQRDHGPLQEVTDDVVFPLRTMEDVEAMNEKLDDSGLMSSVNVANLRKIGILKIKLRSLLLHQKVHYPKLHSALLTSDT